MIGGGWSELTWIMLVSSLASSNKTSTATGNTSNMCRLSRVVKLFSKCCYIKMQENINTQRQIKKELNTQHKQTSSTESKLKAEVTVSSH